MHGGSVGDRFSRGDSNQGATMDVVQLEWFCRAYEERSFAKAAKGVYVSRQAFGRSMKGLEEELGVSLFLRSSAGIEPTAYADRIHPKVRCILKDYRDVLAICDERPTEFRQKVKMAVADGMAASLPPAFLDRLQERNPCIELVIEKHYVRRCLDMLERGEVDFVICSVPKGVVAANSVPLVRRPVYVALPKAGLDSGLSLRALDSVTLFTLGDDFPNDAVFLGLLEEDGISVNINSQYKDYDLIIDEVRAGRGAALVPEECIDRIAGSEAELIPVSQDRFAWEISFLFLERSYTPLEKRLIDFVRMQAELECASASPVE